MKKAKTFKRISRRQRLSLWMLIALIFCPNLALADSTLPASYDLRMEGRVSSVQDQGDYGVCWAFSSLASLESNLITQGYAEKDIDLSEAQLSYFTFHGKNGAAKSKYAGSDTFKTKKWYNDGGSYAMTVATLGRWYGPTTETILPFSAMKKSTKYPGRYRTQKSYVMTDAYFLPDTLTSKGKRNTSGEKMVKKAIMKYGACAVGIGMYKKGFGSNVGAKDYAKQISYYSKNKEPNHAVTVIGWDDKYDFSKHGFQGTKPKGKGAWLVKNSWGTQDQGKTVHQDGYFWVSYYTRSLTNFVSFIGDKTTGGRLPHQNIYQYDGVGVGDELLYDHSVVRGANVFVARKDTLINAISTWIPASDSKINVQIYVNKQKKSPRSGKRLYNKTFKRTYPGYRTIVLGKNVGIPKGSKFSVIITVKTGKKEWYIPAELRASRASSVTLAKQKSGESYLYVDNQWISTHDLYTEYMKIEGKKVRFKIGNATVKAHSIDGGSLTQIITHVKKKKTLRSGRSYAIGAKRLIGTGKLVYRSSNPKVATVDSKGRIRAKKRGKAKIIVNALPTKTYQSTSKTMTVTVK